VLRRYRPSRAAGIATRTSTCPERARRESRTRRGLTLSESNGSPAAQERWEQQNPEDPRPWAVRLGWRTDSSPWTRASERPRRRNCSRTRAFCSGSRASSSRTRTQPRTSRRTRGSRRSTSRHGTMDRCAAGSERSRRIWRAMRAAARGGAVIAKHASRARSPSRARGSRSNGSRSSARCSTCSSLSLRSNARSSTCATTRA